MNIKSILTPIDFSDNAGKIAKAAAYVAGTFQAELHLIFVVQNFEDYSGFFVPPINLPNLEEELFASAQQQMESFMEEQRRCSPPPGSPRSPARCWPATWPRRSSSTPPARRCS